MPSEEDRWRRLIADLKSRLPNMEDEFVHRVREIPSYSGTAVSATEVRITAETSIGLIIDALSGSAHYPRMREYADALGTRRARQGISAESLMSAVRLDFPIIWEGLLQTASTEDALLLAFRAEEVWRVVDDYSTATHSSYVRTRIEMAQEEAGVRQEFISALFGVQGLLPEIRERFTRAYGVSPEAPYGIAAGTGGTAVQLRRLTATPNTTRRIFLYEAENYVYAFWPESVNGSAGQVGLPTGLSAIPCGLARASTGLIGLADAARVAAALCDLSVAADLQPVTVERDWTRLARTRMDSIGVNLRTELEAKLLGARAEEIERLRETALCFISNGSVSNTADALYCHRNTILNRLRRFREITGIDLTIPVQAARAVVAWA